MARNSSISIGLLLAMMLARFAYAQSELAQPLDKASQPAPAGVRNGGIPAENHPWGRFPIGSWKLVRSVAEDLDPLGSVVGTTITETKTTLRAASATNYTLQIDVTMESFGKRIATAPKLITRGYSTDLDATKVTATKSGETEVSVNGRKVSCEVRQISMEVGGAKTESSVCFSPSISPFVLRRETTVAGAEVTQSTTSVEVVALAMPHRVLADRRSVAIIRTIDRKPDRTSTMVEYTCDDIPGGSVSQTSLDQSKDGKTLRRTTVELLDYHVANERPDEAWGGRRRVLHRPRARRAEEMQSSPRR